MTPSGEDILKLARAYGAVRGIGLHGLSKRCGHSKRFIRLAAGRGCTPKTAEHVLRWFANSWPTDLPWPDGIARPR
jgi:hypothetical protein